MGLKFRDRERYTSKTMGISSETQLIRQPLLIWTANVDQKG